MIRGQATSLVALTFSGEEEVAEVSALPARVSDLLEEPPAGDVLTLTPRLQPHQQTLEGVGRLGVSCTQEVNTGAQPALDHHPVRAEEEQNPLAARRDPELPAWRQLRVRAPGVLLSPGLGLQLQVLVEVDHVLLRVVGIVHHHLTGHAERLELHPAVSQDVDRVTGRPRLVLDQPVEGQQVALLEPLQPHRAPHLADVRQREVVGDHVDQSKAAAGKFVQSVWRNVKVYLPSSFVYNLLRSPIFRKTWIAVKVLSVLSLFNFFQFCKFFHVRNIFLGIKKVGSHEVQGRDKRLKSVSGLSDDVISILRHVLIEPVSRQQLTGLVTLVVKERPQALYQLEVFVLRHRTVQGQSPALILNTLRREEESSPGPPFVNSDHPALRHGGVVFSPVISKCPPSDALVLLKCIKVFQAVRQVDSHKFPCNFKIS